MLKKIQKIFKLKNKSVFSELTKIKLSTMNTGVVLYGYLIATPITSAPTILSLSLGTLAMAMASQVKGQIIEKDFDSKMDRTKNRPLPLNKISIKNANFLNYALFFSSNFMLFFGVGYVPIIFCNVTYFSYLFYVRNKVRSKFNTVLGAFPGTFPILIGITQGVDLFSMGSSCFLGISYLFLWNIVHFYAIYITFYEDYGKTGFNNFGMKNLSYIMLLCSVLQLIFIYFWLKDIDFDSKNTFYFLFFNFVLQHASVFNYISKHILKPDFKYGKILRNLSYRMLFTTFTTIYFINLISHYKKKAK